MGRCAWLSMAFVWLLATTYLASGAPQDAERQIPPAFATFEPLIGAWKGTGIPTANRVKGWPERHLWAWKFQDGKPVALSVRMEGGKVLSKAQLSFDPATKKYRLAGADATGKPVTYTGTLDDTGRALTLDRTEPQAPELERLTIRLNSNEIRYTVWLDRQEPGAPQYHRTIEMNLGKEGEAFAAGSSVADRPKCIITGGAATLTVSYEGKSYPICCTGCRDEFLENPVKYVKKAALRAQAEGPDRSKAAASPAVGKDDGAFDGLVPEPSVKPKRKARAKPVPKASPEKAQPKSEPAGETAPAASDRPKGSGAMPTKAASLLRSAQSLERLGKTSSALNYYREIVTKYPKSPQAKTASARIQELTPRKNED